MATKNCPYVVEAISKASSNPELFERLQEKYSEYIYEMAEAIGRDPEKFKVKDALPFIESIYARYF